MSVANTIWGQISVDVKMSCGARDLVASEKGLKFRVGADRGNKKWVLVNLTQRDSYDVEYVEYNARKLELKTVEKCSDVYAQELSALIYMMTHN